MSTVSRLAVMATEAEQAGLSCVCVCGGGGGGGGGEERGVFGVRGRGCLQPIKIIFH